MTVNVNIPFNLNSFEKQIRFSIVLLILVLALFNQAFLKGFRRMVERLEEYQTEQLRVVTQLILMQLSFVVQQQHADWSMMDNSTRNALDKEMANQHLIAHSFVFSLASSDGTILLPRRRTTSPGIGDRIILSREIFDQLDKGRIYMTPLLETATGVPVRTCYVPLLEQGRLAAFLAGRYEFHELVRARRIAYWMNWLRILGFAGALFLALIYVRWVLMPFQLIRNKAQSLTSLRPEREKPFRGNVEYVVSTFESMIEELRRKERELTRLYDAAEERARGIEIYNENILKSIHVGVITVNMNEIVETFNRHAALLLGMESDRILEQPLDTLADESLVRFLREVRDAGEGEEKTVSISRRAATLWLELTGYALRDGAADIIGYTFLIKDVTERREMAERIRQKKRLEELGEMAAGIAHEFRNPLGAIMGYTNLIQKELDGSSNAMNYLREIQQDIYTLNRILEDFLSFVRPTVVSLEPVALFQLVNRSIQLSGIQEREELEWSLDCPRDLEIYGDHHLLQRMLINLLTNAAEAVSGKPGDIRIHVEQAADPVLGRPHSVVIRISDNGCGIAPENRDRIFQPFFTTRSRGTGLGLSIVHKIATAHNGSVEVVSEPENGTTFIIRLPRNQMQAGAG